MFFVIWATQIFHFSVRRLTWFAFLFWQRLYSTESEIQEERKASQSSLFSISFSQVVFQASLGTLMMKLSKKSWTVYPRYLLWLLNGALWILIYLTIGRQTTVISIWEVKEALRAIGSPLGCVLLMVLIHRSSRSSYLGMACALGSKWCPLFKTDFPCLCLGFHFNLNTYLIFISFTHWNCHWYSGFTKENYEWDMYCFNFFFSTLKSCAFLYSCHIAELNKYLFSDDFLPLVS